MSLITSSVTFTVGVASPVATTTVDIGFGIATGPIVLPGDPVGVTAGELRRLTYPGGLFAPIIY